MMLAMKRTLNINCSWAEYSVAKVLMHGDGGRDVDGDACQKEMAEMVVLYESSKSRWGFEFCYGP